MEAIPNKNVRRFRLHFASSEGTRNVYPRKKHLNYTSSILFMANSGCQKNATPQPQTTIWRDTYWQKVVYQTISNSSQNILYYTIKVQTKLEWRLRTFLSDVNIWRSFGRHVPFYHHLHCTSWAVAPGWLLISCILVRPFWAHTSQLFLHTTYPSIWMNNLRYGNRNIQKHPQKMKVVDCAFRWNKGPTTILWTLHMCRLVPMSNQWETLWDKTLAINLLQMGFSSSFSEDALSACGSFFAQKLPTSHIQCRKKAMLPGSNIFIRRL